MERAIIRDLVSHILELSMHLLKGINFAAELDCCRWPCSFFPLAFVAHQNNYVRPTLTAEVVLHIRNGRHVLQEITVDTYAILQDALFIVDFLGSINSFSCPHWKLCSSQCGESVLN